MNKGNTDVDETLKSLGFQVVYNIGQGNFAMVKLATSERFSKRVAIKIMDRKRLTPFYASKFLPRELDILKRVNHPHIVQVHEIFEENDLVFIVMEAASMTLSDKIKQLRHIPIDQAKTWFSQLVSAVVYLHQQGIVHRDLKCENVLLTADGQIKLTDFGLGRVLKNAKIRSWTFSSTISYASPEVLLKKPYDPRKRDVWSLGVILHYMVTGYLPFRGFVNLPQLQKKPLKYAKDISVEKSCQEIISYMLQYDPSARPSVTDVAEHPWMKLDQEEVTSSLRAAEKSSVPGEVHPPQEDDSSRASSSRTGCFSSRPISSGIKNAVKSVTAPISRAPRETSRRLKKLFTSVGQISSSSQKDARDCAASTEAAASSSTGQRHEEGTPGQPAARRKTKRVRLPKIKVKKKAKRKVQP